ncbi:phospholipase D-like domain-containing protein [Paenibacillus polymyxa]|uniref:phospholipase D-like domain-containing protein n=1 Tax=Paenibacillus polymyxa TaxID=1406 RepID=UPI00129A5BD0|nr:phospholipase D family protein [Paenibacillus polymyxa]KAE8561748.1 hypothetical protein BJH92_02035 [Paenibacillus polymyxa]MCJ1221127.1 phospholipase D-like domain-containing protein [Paenibacillus polymyxa]
MQIQFIGQGLRTNDLQVGNIINESLIAEKYNHFVGYIAFVSEGGVDRIRNNLVQFISKAGNTAVLFVGVDNKATSKEALEALLNIKVPTYVYHIPNPSIIYHPKVYVFKGQNEYRIITGSSNMTTTGLYQNVEASFLIDADCQTERDLLDDVESYFAEFLGATDKSLRLLDQTLIDQLDLQNKIPSESSRKYGGEVIIGEDSADYDTNQGASNSGAAVNTSLFPKRDIPSAPARSTQKPKSETTSGSEGTSVTQEGAAMASENTVAATESAVTDAEAGANTTTSSSPADKEIGATTPPSGGISTNGSTASPPSTETGAAAPTSNLNQAGRTIWFQTGALTGGSGNILDLSQVGRNGGQGGIQLLNPRMINNLSITIRYNGTDYTDNTVKFPLNSSGKTNGTWRLQMKGTGPSRQKFTDHTRNDQLKYKILVLHEIGPDHYELTVEPNSMLSHYQSISSFVEQSPPRGRFYGRI